MDAFLFSLSPLGGTKINKEQLSYFWNQALSTTCK